MNDSLVSVAWLAEHLDDPTVQVVDVRSYLMEPNRGREEYLAEHISGAVFMSLDHDLARPPYDGPGRHPIPAPEAFAAAAGRSGIGPDTLVVAYDAGGGAWAARLWWLLRYFGHEQVALLDGGWQAWQAAGLPTVVGAETAPAATFTAQPRPAMVVDADAVDDLRTRSEAVVIDARAAERYQGLTEPIDRKAGHVPGAHNVPFATNLNPDMTFKSPDHLREQYAAVGADTAETVVCYCGSGVTAAHDIFALRLLGIDAKLYEGSWSDWSNDPERPVATGT